MRNLYRLAALVLFILSLIVVAGCSLGNDKSREDSHDLTRVCHGSEDPGTCIDKSAKRVIAMHNKFPNVVVACDGHGHRLFTTSSAHSSRLLVLTDPTCSGYVPQPAQAAGTP